MADTNSRERADIRNGVMELFGEIDADTVADLVARVLSPQDIYSQDTLEAWAEDNGFVKKDEALTYCEESGALLNAGYEKLRA